LTGLELTRSKAIQGTPQAHQRFDDILAKEARVLTIIKDELKAIKEKYATPRLTDLIAR